MSDDGYEPQADLTQEALLASDRDPESGTLPQVSSWESLRRESANRARKNSQAGSNADDQSSDRPSSSGYGRAGGTGSIWSAADTEYSHPMGRWEKEGEFLIPLECYQRMSRWKKCCVLFSALFILFLTVMIPVTFAVIVPGIIDDAVGQSTTVLIRAVVSEPNASASTIRMTTHLQLNNAGSWEATLDSFPVTISDGETGIAFGTLVMPEIKVKANGPTDILVNDTMFVSNPGAFSAATAKVLIGPCDPTCNWRAVGRPTVHIKVLGIELAYETSFHGDIPLPLTQLAEAQADNMQFTGGSETKVWGVAETTFFSQSLLELHNLGHMVFNLKTPGPNGVTLGNASMANFQVLRGFNFFPKAVTTLEKTAENQVALAKFMGDVSQGIDTPMVLSGPVDGCPLFMQHIAQQNFTVKGVTPDRASPVRQSLITLASANGHTTVGGECSPLNLGDCIRGSVNVLYSPMKLIPMTMRDLDLEAYLLEPIEFTFQNDLLSPKRVHCNRTDKFVRQFTRAGMFPPPNQQQDFMTLLPNKSTSFFVPAQPLDGPPFAGPACAALGVIGSPYDCCYTGLQLATACRAKSRGQQSFDTRINGTVTVGFGNFSINVVTTQPLVTAYFEDAFTTNFDNTMSCDSVTIIE